MSLVAWYPLNGDLEDYSRNSKKAENYGATVGNSGKIGKCYQFNGVSNYMQIPNPLKNKSVFSICFWLKAISENVWGDILTFNTGVDGTACRIEKTEPAGQYCWFASTGAIQAGSILFIHDKTKWEHITITVDELYVKTYKNGILQYTYNKASSLIPNCDTINIGRRLTASYYGMNLNDLRFYDHALSPKEVSEIAKAKVLHYTFDEFQEPTVNFVGNILSDYITKGTISVVKDNILGRNCLRITRFNGGTGYVGIASKALQSVITSPASKKYTLSIEYYIPNTLSQQFRVYCPEWNAAGTLLDYRHYITLQNSTGKIIKSVTTWTASISAAYYSAVSLDFLANASTTDDTIYVFSLQLEEKDHATPYTEKERKSEDSVISDSSGYRYNTTLGLATAPKWIEGRIGKGAYDFGLHADDRYFEVPNFPNITDALTVSLWAYVKDSGDFDKPMITKSNMTDFSDGWGIWDGYTTDMRMSVGNGTTAYTYNSPTNFYLDNWVHIVARFNGTKIDLFYNGVKSGVGIDITGSMASNAAPLRIGRQYRNGYSTMEGYLDDIRIYATALSDEDILALYRTVASTDNRGNLYVNNISEPISKVLVKDTTLNIHDDAYMVLTSVIPQETDMSSFVESDNTLGNAYIEGWVYCTSAAYGLARFECTYENNTKGFIIGNLVPIDGVWKAGWNFVRSKITVYEDQANTPWYKMNRLELYRTGPATGSDTTQSIRIKNLCLKKYIDNYNVDPIISIDNKKVMHCLSVNEVGPTHGLIAYWKFNGDTKDYSGNKNHAELVGNVKIAQGPISSAYEFPTDAISHIKLPLNTMQNLQDFTISMWVSSRDLAVLNCIMHGTKTGANNFSIEWYAGYMNMVLEDKYHTFNISYNTNQWYHITFTRDQSNIKMYRFGILVATVPSQYTLPVNITGYLEIGQEQDTLGGGFHATQCLNGKIADVRIYNRALSDTEIISLYNANKIGSSVHVSKEALYVSKEIKEVY